MKEILTIPAGASTGDIEAPVDSQPVGVPHRSATGIFTKQHFVQLDGKELELISRGDCNVWLPKMWSDDKEAVEAFHIAERILAPADHRVLDVPWIVGSVKEDIAGNPRSGSQSHLSGRAFDISPMYSRHELLDPDRAISGLAWNMVKLLALATLDWKQAAMVVEGDHIHVEKDGKPELLPPGKMYTVWSMSPWYAIASKTKSAVGMTPILSAAQMFDVATLTNQGPSPGIQRAMLEYLGVR